MKRYFNLWFTLLIAGMLIIPYILTLYGVEPYPAIILPSGASRVNIGQNSTFRRISLWGRDKVDGDWKRVNPRPFLKPIPVSHLKSLARNSFGLNSIDERVKVVTLPGVRLTVPNTKVTSSEIQEAKHWLSQRLIQLGYAPDELMITTDEAVLDTSINKIIRHKRLHEEIIRLD